MIKSAALILAAWGLCAGAAFAGPEAFVPGAHIEGFGRYAPVADPSVTPDAQFRIAYDVASAVMSAEPGLEPAGQGV